MSRSSKKASPKKVLFISGLLTIIGLGFLSFGIITLFKAKNSTLWPHTAGRVLFSSVESHKSGSNSNTTYKAEILYEFTIDDRVYNGKRVAYGDYSSSNSSHAYKIVNKYPKDKIVNVFYNPKNYEECLLEPGIKSQTWFISIFGLFFMLGGALMLKFWSLMIGKKSLRGYDL